MIATMLILAFDAKVDMGVVFSKPGGEELKMDIYYPADRSKPAPALLVLHGGAWIGGNRADMAEFCQAAADRGFVAATASYRLAPNSKWPAMLDDAQTAVRYLRANASKLNIDPKKVAATGASAGGHLALLLGFRDTRDSKAGEYATQSSRVKAVLNVFGPTDLTQDYPPAFDFLFQTVLGKPKKDSAEDIRQASPVTFVAPGAAPVFTIHGTADQIVPVMQAKRLDAALKAKKIDTEMVIIEGMGHEAGGKDEGRRKQFLDAVAKGLEFVRKHLG
ncbi:MAG TPA: alpha/beta hydrolase [Fimbriimonadaceae bacterium]|nr:alpha/beta hydrolase [Fimbriimonadaceae bacterium]